MDRGRLLVGRFIRENPQFVYTIKFNEMHQMFVLSFITDVGFKSLPFPCGISYDVVLKKFNNGICSQECKFCFETECTCAIRICPDCAYRICCDCFLIMCEHNLNEYGLPCPQCKNFFLLFE